MKTRVRKNYRMELRELIDRLGGATKIGYELGVTEGAVLKWVQNGVPVYYWDDLMLRAEEIGEELDANYFYSILEILD